MDVKITVFNKEINNGLDEMILKRQQLLEPIIAELQSIKNSIGKLIAQKEFLEARGSLTLEETLKPLLDELAELHFLYNKRKEESKGYIDTVNSELDILEKLKKKYI
ncbi:MAG: hypothetical protein K0S41_3683 [Anaerocolumna sp.]|nr:hypothetical protein [Anaerocolumna sp.]